MEYVYAALLLHKLKQNITEENVKNVIKATGTTPDDIRIKALVAALSEVNIDDALKSAPITVAPAATVAATGTGPTEGTTPKEEAKKEEKKEEKEEEAALEGLSALFG